MFRVFVFSVRGAILCVLGAVLCLIGGGAAAAQETSPPASLGAPGLDALQQTVKRKTEEWTKLAQDLDPALIRLLPCDPKVAAAITEVTNASDARLAAIADYLAAANRQAQLQADAAKKVLASAEALGPDLGAEKSDLAPERAGVDGEIANLTLGAQRRASFTPAQDALKQISTMEQQRSDTLDSAMGRVDPAAAALGDLIVQLQARQAAWKGVETAFDAERSRWSGYYAARLARAQTECTITKATAPPRPAGKQTGKQK